MKRLIYASAATKPFSESELDALLETSRNNNQREGLTGMLLYREGDFLQVLEGEPEAIKNTYKRINKDNRHNRLLELDESDIDEREFEQWSMGFKRLSKENTPDGFIDFFNRSFEESQLTQRGSEALNFLRHFKQIGSR